MSWVDYTRTEGLSGSSTLGVVLFLRLCARTAESGWIAAAICSAARAFPPHSGCDGDTGRGNGTVGGNRMGWSADLSMLRGKENTFSCLHR